MASDQDDRGLQPLDVDDCLDLLSSRAVGRLAVNVDGDGPFVIPVNYVVSDGLVVFRTDPGTKLDAVALGPVSFQVDEIDPFRHTGWSVLVRGRAEAIPASESEHLSLEPWPAGAKDFWFRIVAHSMTGRKIALPGPEPGQQGYL